jgi:hypothetical protein
MGMGDLNRVSGLGGQPWPDSKRQKDSFLDGWADRSALWGSRHGLGESIDRYMGLHAPSGRDAILTNDFASLGLDEFEGKGERTLGYGSVLKLNTDHIPWKELSWDRFQNQVKSNTYEFRQAIQGRNNEPFFSGISLKDFRNGVLWKRNIEPIQALFSGSRQNLFMNLGYTAGVGLVGFNILKTTQKAYQNSKTQEDGTFRSQLNTYYQTVKAFGQKTIQSAGSWIAADIGMTIGRALIPIGAFPLGGIIMGAFTATLAAKGIGKLFEEVSD